MIKIGKENGNETESDSRSHRNQSNVLVSQLEFVSDNESIILLFNLTKRPIDSALQCSSLV